MERLRDMPQRSPTDETMRITLLNIRYVYWFILLACAYYLWKRVSRSSNISTS
jgi:hypothetical protein